MYEWRCKFNGTKIWPRSKLILDWPRISKTKLKVQIVKLGTNFHYGKTSLCREAKYLPCALVRWHTANLTMPCAGWQATRQNKSTRQTSEKVHGKRKAHGKLQGKHTAKYCARQSSKMHTAKFAARQTDRRGPHPQPGLTDPSWRKGFAVCIGKSTR